MTAALATRKSLEPWIRDEVAYYPHQIEGVRDLAKRRSFLLADEMGLGKSLQALTVFAVDVVRNWASSCIVVCPVTLKRNWTDEIEKFTGFWHMILEGSPTRRREQLVEFTAHEGPKVLIVNYEQVTPHLDTLNELKFDIAIFDEAHYLKNHRAKRTQACLALYSRRSFLLTGTPMLNHVNELWPILHRIHPDAFPKYYSFVNRYCVFGGWQAKQIVGVKNERELTDRLQQYQLRRLKKDVLDLPEVQIIERRVDLAPEQQKLYEQAVNDLELPDPDSADPMQIENALTKFLRLKQICGTTFPFTGEDISSKLDLAIEDAEELLLNGNKIVVFTQFRGVLECFKNRLEEKGRTTYFLHGDVPTDRRQLTVRAWTDRREPTAIICMLQVAGVGLNMVAARHAMFLDKLFTPGMNKQAIDRLHRIGQDESQSVQVLEYICRNTVENRVNQILRTKSKLFGEIVETDPLWKQKLLKAMMEE